MSCPRCAGIGWVCEEHPDQPMRHEGCRGAGDPCPVCNALASRDQPPNVPRDFKVDYDKDGSRH
jgi:hypothetical protein